MVVMSTIGKHEITERMIIGNILEVSSLSLTSLIEFINSLRYCLNMKDIMTPKNSLS